jgi:hypothetical protein
LREAHETTTGKAVAAVLVPVFLLVLFAGMLFIIAMLLGVATQLPV